MAAKKTHHFTPKQRKFIDYFEGNGAEACRKAGYSDVDIYKQASLLMNDPRIMAAVREREEREGRAKAKANVGHILTRAERQAFWTQVIIGTDDDGKPLHEMKDRLKASELLGKSEADFTDNVKHDASKTLAELLTASYRKPE